MDCSFLSDSSASINDLYIKFHGDTINFIDNHVPKKKVARKYLKLRSKPWINTYIQKLMGHRDKLFQNMNKDPTLICTKNLEIVSLLKYVVEK